MNNQLEAMKLIRENKELTQTQKDLVKKKLMMFAMFEAKGRTSECSAMIDFIGLTNEYMEKELNNDN